MCMLGVLGDWQETPVRGRLWMVPSAELREEENGNKCDRAFVIHNWHNQILWGDSSDKDVLHGLDNGELEEENKLRDY